VQCTPVGAHKVCRSVLGHFVLWSTFSGGTGAVRNEIDKNIQIIVSITYNTLESRDSSVGIVTYYGLDDWISNPGGGWEFFTSTSCPDLLWGPLSLLSNGYRGLFP
jgi:hypothetical protein